jgi:hypothetical protein
MKRDDSTASSPPVTFDEIERALIAIERSASFRARRATATCCAT